MSTFLAHPLPSGLALNPCPIMPVTLAPACHAPNTPCPLPPPFPKSPPAHASSPPHCSPLSSTVHTSSPPKTPCPFPLNPGFYSHSGVMASTPSNYVRTCASRFFHFLFDWCRDCAVLGPGPKWNTSGLMSHKTGLLPTPPPTHKPWCFDHGQSFDKSAACCVYRSPVVLKSIWSV